MVSNDLPSELCCFFKSIETKTPRIPNNIPVLTGALDPIRFGYKEGRAFLDRLHASGRHYVPIIDSAIYVPNPDNSSDAYQPFDDGNATGSFLLNPDGSLMIGEVWPGYEEDHREDE